MKWVEVVFHSSSGTERHWSGKYNYAESSDPFSCTSAWAPNQDKRPGGIFLAFAAALTSVKKDGWKRNADVFPGAEPSSELKAPHACCGKNMVGNVTDDTKCVFLHYD